MEHLRLKGKITVLEEALEEALKVEEIQFFGVASQSSTNENLDYAINCIDGRHTGKCNTQYVTDQW